MQKKLFTQIRNEWLGNTWLALELLVVSVVMWFIIDMLYCRAATYLEPRGFDTEHCYRIYLGSLTEKSPDYVPYEDIPSYRDDILEVVERLRRRPEVEAVSLSQNAHPYNGNNSGCSLEYDTLRSSGFVVRRYIAPGIGQHIPPLWHSPDPDCRRRFPLRRRHADFLYGYRPAARALSRLSAGLLELHGLCQHGAALQPGSRSGQYLQ